MEPLKLMIVEDDAFILSDLSTIVDWSAQGFEVVTASNGRQGLHKFEQCLPMAVITDVRMPFMDGLEMMARIKQRNPYIQFLVLSAYNDFAPVQEALRQGARDYILKQDISAELLLEKTEVMRAALDEQREFAFNAVQSRLYELLSAPTADGDYLQEKFDGILRLAGYFPENLLLRPAEEFAVELLRRNGEDDSRIALLQSGSGDFFNALKLYLLSDRWRGKVQSGHTADPAASAMVARAKEYIQARFRDPDLSTTNVAKEIGISYGRLSVLFKEQTGNTLNDYLTDVRIQEAKRLLCTEDYKIYEVAELSGYHSSQYFSYAFRSKVGQSPNSYRKGE